MVVPSKEQPLLLVNFPPHKSIIMIKKICCFLLLLCLSSLAMLFAQSYTMEEVTSYPFISEVAATEKGSKIALSINEKGMRNIYVGEGPQFKLRKITNYNSDEGQEITSVTISADGKWIVYVRGGDHGAFDRSLSRNPSSSIEKPAIQLYSIPFAGGEPVLLGEGDYPVFKPGNKEVTFLRNNQVYGVPVDGSKAPSNLFFANGRISSIQWSEDGSRMLFVSSRGSHSFIGIYTKGASSIKWIAPAFARDVSPRWSPDEKNIVFVRRPAAGGAVDSLTAPKHLAWEIWKANVVTGKAEKLWKAPETLQGSVPNSHGSFNLHWAAKDRIVFLSYQDGWPHLYSISTNGDKPILLTKGDFVVEQIQLSPDKKFLLFASNAGRNKDDLDRRHIGRVPVDEAKMEILTEGVGIESTPVFTNNGASFLMLSATAQRPTLAAVMSFGSEKIQLIGENLIPRNFPTNGMIIPEHVEFKAPDGKPIYGQLFQPNNISGKNPAVLFIHGGPRRQMLLGWHYMDYYANTYAINQYLASKGFVVLSVNYRMGIGYGYDFQNPLNTELYGATEYQDIRSAGEWLAARADVDSKKIGVYGGSYGGFLTALALGRDSKLFAAGVDISGMHNFMDEIPDGRKGELPPDYELAKKLAWESSPVAHLDTWTSPVLIISGDDDGNVDFYESVDLARRFQEKGFAFESLVVPDETHHWMKYGNMLTMDEATADFLERKLGVKKDVNALSGKTICIDPGHGGTALTDQYRVGAGGEREEWINLRVAKILEKKLKEKGATVIMTRTVDTFIPLADRAKIAVDNKADAFLCIHHNATADTTVNFPIIYFHGAASENLAGVSFGKALSSSLKKYLYNAEVPESLNSDYTIFPDGGAAVLRGTYGIPAILSEASFFTNPTEEQRLKQEVYNAREADAMVDALETFFSGVVPVIKPKEIPLSLPGFPVFEEADRMQAAALDWHKDFVQGTALMKSAKKKDLQKAYDLFTRSAKSFPDSYLARQAHTNRAILLEKLNRPDEAKAERKRVAEYYVNMNEPTK